MTFLASTFPLLGENKKKDFNRTPKEKKRYVSIDVRHFEWVENMHLMRRMALTKV
jgi:hypothetical protein